MRVAVVFGQFGALADPVNLPHFERRLIMCGYETILVQHTDTQRVYNWLNQYLGPCGIVGASLGAGIAPIMAGYLRHRTVNFVGGFQPSDWDPVMHTGATGLRTVTVPANVPHAVCFRNPVAAVTAGLGHAIYDVADSTKTKLQIIENGDIHPGDFGVAQDQMVKFVQEYVR